jgi:hypothetical protein
MTIIPNIPASARSSTKKALLIGISYHKGEKGRDHIPTSIPNARKFAAFLRGEHTLPPSILSRLHTVLPRRLEHCGYTDIVMMTDEEGGDIKLQPTKDNLVRPFPRSHPGFTYANNSFHQKREIRALTRGAMPGDRRVFYCMNYSVPRSLSSMLILPSTLSRRTFGPAALHNW